MKNPRQAPPARKAALAYYILERRLEGWAGGIYFQIAAGSGGAAQTGANWTANNPYAAGIKTVAKSARRAHVHGGPIPPGAYTIYSPKQTVELPGCKSFVSRRTIKRAAFLKPSPTTQMFCRNSFYIHAGFHTDGCIAVPNHADFDRLMDALDRDEGGKLRVEETIEGYRFA